MSQDPSNRILGWTNLPSHRTDERSSATVGYLTVNFILGLTGCYGLHCVPNVSDDLPLRIPALSRTPFAIDSTTNPTMVRSILGYEKRRVDQREVCYAARKAPGRDCMHRLGK